MAALGFEPTADTVDDGAAVLVEDGTADTLDWSTSEPAYVVDQPDIHLHAGPDLADGFDEAAPPTTAEADDAMTPPKGRGKGPQTYRRSARARPTPKPSAPPMPDPSTALDPGDPDHSGDPALDGYDYPDVDGFAAGQQSLTELASDATGPIPAGRFSASRSSRGAHSSDPPPPILDDGNGVGSDRANETLVVDGLSLDGGQPSNAEATDQAAPSAGSVDGYWADDPHAEGHHAESTSGGVVADESPGLFDPPPPAAPDTILAEEPPTTAPTQAVRTDPPPPAPPETLLVEAPPTTPPIMPDAEAAPVGTPPPPLVGDPTTETSLNANGAVAAPAGAGATIAARSEEARARGGDLAARMPQLLDQGLLKRTGRVRSRKVRRVVRHIDPWSVLTFSVLFFLCLFAALLLASVLVWNAAVAAGTIENIESFIREIGDYQTYEINGDVVFRAAMVIAGIFTLAASVMVVLLVVVFNLISDLVGGIRVTVVEEETIRVRRANQ